MTKIQTTEPKFLNFENFKDFYIDVQGDLEHALSLIVKNEEVSENYQNLLFIGPPGTGKSLLVHTLVNKLEKILDTKIPVETLDCSEDTREYHLKGMYIMDGDDTPFVLGALTSAIEIANEVGICVLNLEEISALTPGAQKMLNGVLDWKKSVSIPEANKLCRLEDGAVLIVTASMNPSGYGGVNSLNADLKSRFGGKFILDFPKAADEHKILKSITNANDLLISCLIKVAHLTRAKVMDYQISTRDLRNTIESYTLSGNLTKSLFSLAVNYEEDQLSTVLEAMESCFDDVQLRSLIEKEAFNIQVNTKFRGA